MRLRFHGHLPQSSADKLLAALNDTHAYGLIQHTVEVIVWRRNLIAFLAGASVTLVAMWVATR